MRAVRTSLPSPVHRKLCLACGYDGPAIQDWGDWSRHRGMSFTCPACGEDLYARPPRSYAELEGLNDEPGLSPLDPFPQRRSVASSLRLFFFSSLHWLCRFTRRSK